MEVGKTTSLEFLGRKILFSAESSISSKRVASFHVKEPDTVAMISSLGPGDVFWDIGASTGIYSVPAATTGAMVYAFEPKSGNFFDLTVNSNLNGVGENLMALNVAISDESKATHLFVSDQTPGAAMNTIDRSWAYRGGETKSKFIHGVLALSASDILRFGVKPPSHVKIDVDGLEPQITKSLAPIWHGVKTAIIEIDSGDERHMGIFPIMEDLGFHCSNDQVIRARRVGGPNDGVGNVVWTR